MKFLCHFSWKNAWNSLGGNVKECPNSDQMSLFRPNCNFKASILLDILI
jgi:hypothetical protein